MQTNITKCVIKYLERKDFKYIRCLDEGGFDAAISVFAPDKNEIAVNIEQKCNVWEIEDRYWPILQHPNILAVINTMIIVELSVKLYFMPMLPKIL